MLINKYGYYEYLLFICNFLLLFNTLQQYISEVVVFFYLIDVKD